jgi:serine-aspartate repeat-containing protein C/D/E
MATATPTAIPANLTGVAWFDSNQDGIRDPGESSVPGVTVMLYTTGGELVATTVTDNEGQYLFTNLPYGDYYLVFVAPPGYQSTVDNRGDDDALDSDPQSSQDGLTAQTPPITLHPGNNIESVDYGLELAETPPLTATLGNRVWLDQDRNGVQDANEAGVAGVAVTLYNAAGTVISNTVADGNGTYLFGNLAPGVYYVQFVLPEGYDFSPPGSIVGSDTDSNADPSTGQTGLITLTGGAQDLSWDAGIHQKPTALEDGDEPNQPGNAVYLPLVARTGIKAKPREGIPKVIVILHPCHQQRCITP